MPVRIYALAKELNVDSKELVEVCNRAGVTGKGSALASLSDDEVAKVKEYLSGGSSSGGGGGTATATKARSNEPAAPVTRDQYVRIGGNTGKPRVLTPKAKAKPKEEEQPSVPAAKAQEEEAEETVVQTPPEEAPEAPALEEAPVAKAPPTHAEQKEETPAEPTPPPAAPEKKTDPLAPQRYNSPFRDRVADLNRPKRSGDNKGEKKPRDKDRAKPVIAKLAAIPKSTGKTPKARSNEPAPQKPIMTLPADAIRGAKAGAKAPLEQFTKQQDRKRGVGEGGSGSKFGPPASEPATTGSGRGRKGKGKGGGDGEETGEGKKLAGMASSRAARQQNRRRGNRNQIGMDRDETPRRSRLVRKGTNTAAPRKGKVTVDLPCTIRSLSEATGVPTVAIQRALMQMGTMVTINVELDPEIVELVAVELEMEVEFKQAATLEDKLLSEFEEYVDNPDDLVPRPPVITFLGHVDHGKTSLLDRLIGIDVVSGEAGGITQHIRAYQIEKDGRPIAFVDTPGHEAFTEMRARGANVTDIAVLVVAADDGIMPQTEEAISHAKAAGVPIVVALNKCDLPGVDPMKAMTGLSQHELTPAEWGGETEVVKTSAITGEGLDDLLELLLLTADIEEYKANPKRPAMGTCLEAEQEGNRGVAAKVMVQNGTLKVGDVVVCGGAHGRVKAMTDTLHPRKKLKEAGPSMPVNLFGLDIAPGAGDHLYVMEDIAEARQIAEQRQVENRSQALSGRSTRVSFDEFQRRLEEGVLGTGEEVGTLNIILRADVRGSIEAIQKELGKLQHDEVEVKLLMASVGGITSGDVHLANASDAVIVGFNVIPDEAARSLADERGVEIRRYDIIYKVTEDIKALLEGKLKPEERVKDLGRALVQQIFSISRVGNIAGCRVLAGTIQRGCRVRVNRNGRGIGDYPLDSLRREKDDTKEVREGYECGMKLQGFDDLKEGDILEAYVVEEVARTL